MKKNENMPPKFKQSKLSAFWSSQSHGKSKIAFSEITKKKRKGSDEIFEFLDAPKKKISIESQDLFIIPSENIENGSFKNKEYSDEGGIQFRNTPDDIFSEDIENSLLLSPRKEKPKSKKNFLTHNNHINSFIEDSELCSIVSELIFEKPLKCKVTKFAMVTTSGRYEQILKVKDEITGKNGFCRLRDAWTFLSVSVNDSVVIKASLHNEKWVVDNQTGYIVLHPEFIISSTSLVKGMFCMRQGLFSYFYKGIETGSNKKMLIGKMVHEFFQKCLKLRSCTDNDFADAFSAFLQTRDYIKDLYFTNTKSDEIQRELKSFVPQIREFLDVYIKGERKPLGKNFSEVIEDILDIEELVKSPNLGLQGRIDVTVKIKSKNKKKKIAPLELKTGRASFSKDHISQLIQYILMMNETGRKVESGLLLYLKEGIMEEVVANRDEIRNLLLLRNQLVGYYKSFKCGELPEPPRNISKCEKCPYLRVCTTYLKSESNYETHALMSIETSDIKPSHVNYFMKWNKMLWLEYESAMDKAESSCEVENLILIQKGDASTEGVKHYFKTASDEIKRKLTPGAFGYLFNDKKEKICSFTIADFTNTTLSLYTQKVLTDTSSIYKVVIVKFKFVNLYLSNLGMLLCEQYKNLREIIIDKRLPTFDGKINKIVFEKYCLSNLTELNKEQRMAVLKSLFCNSYLLIKGPPGTGKTHTIVTLVKALLALGKTILIAGHTHSSVDNILLRLNDVEFLRLGPLKSIKKSIHKYCLANLIQNCSSVEDFQKLLDRKLIASTCAGLDDEIVAKKKFNFCIIDESSQVLQPEIIRPLLCSDKFVLVGDEDQLPPIVENVEAKKLGMNISMFEWLMNEAATVKLKFQFRMNRRINTLANALAYNGLLECANEVVANSTVKIKNLKNFYESQKWVQKVLSPVLEDSVVFIDTSFYFVWKKLEASERPRSSVVEANIIKKLLINLRDFGIDEGDVGVITPFSDQILLLKEKILKNNLFNAIEFNTVDQYQGRDKDVILFSCGKENQPKMEVTDAELLNDLKRLTVAITRAKHKLILVGDRKTVVSYKPFKKLLANLKDNNFVNLSEGKEGFTWEDVED